MYVTRCKGRNISPIVLEAWILVWSVGVKSERWERREVPMNSRYTWFLAVVMLFPMGVVESDGVTREDQRKLRSSPEIS